MYGDLCKDGYVLQRLEHRTPKLTAKINRSADAVLKTEPQLVPCQGLHLDYLGNHHLLQWFDLAQGLSCQDPRPVFREFRLMKSSPLLDQPECARAQIAFQYRTVVDANRRLFVSVLRVEMRWRMVVLVHGDDNAEKSADLWHFWLPSIKRLEIRLRSSNARACDLEDSRAK